MELKMRTEIHEIEERKNHHINDLIQNHEKAFKELKQFYNSTTSENLGTIKDQRKQHTRSTANHQNNQKLIHQIKGVNAGLKVSPFLFNTLSIYFINKNHIIIFLSLIIF